MSKKSDVARHTNSDLPMNYSNLHLVDFVRLWPSEFRGVAEQLLEKNDIQVREKFVIEWMIELADRVGTEDVED